MAVNYKGIVRGNVVVLEGDRTLPDGTRVTIIPESEDRRPCRSLSDGELRRRREACERIEILAEHIARTARPTLNLAENVIDTRTELEERV